MKLKTATCPCSKEDDGAELIEFTCMQDDTDATRMVINRAGKVAKVWRVPTEDAISRDPLAGLVRDSTTVNARARGLFVPEDGGRVISQRPKARSLSRRGRRARTADPRRPSPPFVPGKARLPAWHVPPPPRSQPPPPGVAMPPGPPPPRAPPDVNERALVVQEWAFAAAAASPSDQEGPCQALARLDAACPGPSAARPTTPRLPPQPSRPVPAAEESWQILTKEAHRCALQIMEQKTHRGLEPQEWRMRIVRAIEHGPCHGGLSSLVAASPRICLCVPSFKRTWQLQQTLPINLMLAWKLRHRVTFVLADLNPTLDADMIQLMRICQPARRCGFLKWYRRRSIPAESDGFTHWHASVGKNAAHMAAIPPIGEKQQLLVELDNDNFVSDEFFAQIDDHADRLFGCEHEKLAGLHWRHPKCPPCTGRTRAAVACPREANRLG